MNRRTLLPALLLALAATGLGPSRAFALGEPLTDGEIETIELRARGDFISSAIDEGLDGEAASLVFGIERETAPILDLTSTMCPVQIDVDNVSNHAEYGVYFEVRQSFERNGIPVSGGYGDTVSRVEIPFVPARTRVRARIECPTPPSSLLYGSPYDSPISRGVQFSTFAEVYGLEDEGLASMSSGQAAFSREYEVFTPGSSLHPLLWHVIDLSTPGDAYDDLLDRLFENVDGRRIALEYLADSQASVQATVIAARLADLPAAQLIPVYTGLSVDVAGRVLSQLDERAFTRTARALRTTPEGRTALIALLSAPVSEEQFDSVAADIDDTTLESGVVALAAGSWLEERRVALFDELITRVRALPPERQNVLALALFTRWVDHQIPSQQIETRVLALRDMGRPMIDSLLRQRVLVIDDIFSPGTIGEDIDALELYQMFTHDLGGCTTSMERLGACADLIEGTPALASAANATLSSDFLARAQSTMVENVSADTADLAHRYQSWGLDVGPIAERACYGGGYYGYGYGHEDEGVEWARAIQPDAPCVLAIVRREEQEATVRLGRYVIGFFIAVLAIAGAVFFGRRGLRHLEGVRREDEKTQPVEDGGRVAARIAPEPFAAAFGRGLHGSESAIRAEGTAESEAVVSALAALRPHEGALTKAAQGLVEEVVARGKLRSTVLELGGQSVYLVVVPGMHDQPQAFRRYAPFAQGWLTHVDRLKAMLGRSGLPSKLLCLFLFVRPDGSETALVVGYEDGTTRYLPFGILDEEEVHAGAGRQGTHREQWSPERGNV